MYKTIQKLVRRIYGNNYYECYADREICICELGCVMLGWGWGAQTS